MRMLLAVPVVLGIALSGPVANADMRPVDEGGNHEPCVTFDEFQLAHGGTSMGRVQRIFDTNGRRVSGHKLDTLAETLASIYGEGIARGRIVRQYRTCTDDPETAGDAYVEFSHQRGKWRVRLSLLTGTS